jgi:hypothetical protein
MAIAVVIMAVILTGAENHQYFHHIYWARIVEDHAEQEQRCREMAASEPRGSWAEGRWLAGVVHHGELKRRYKEVRDNPWRPVPRDLSFRL